MPRIPKITVLLLGHRAGKMGRMQNATLTVLATVVVSLIGVGLWAASTAYYKVKNQELQTRLADLELLSGRYNERLNTIIEKEQDTRIVVGLPDIHPDVREVGVGGALVDGSIPDEPDSPLARSAVLQRTLDQLIREASLSLSSLEEIEAEAEDTQTYWDRVPTVRPVKGVTTSRFGMRNDPFTGLRRMHNGIDIAANRGTPVHATAAGTVSQTGLNAYLGLFVEVDHKNGLITRYGHLSALGVTVDQEISRRTVIGNVGKTGRANGYHLHYEVRRHGNRVDPGLHFWPEQNLLRPCRFCSFGNGTL